MYIQIIQPFLRLLHQESNRYWVTRFAKKNENRISQALSGPGLLPKEALAKRKMENCWAGMELTLRYLQNLKFKLDQSGVRLGVHMYPTGAQVRKYPKKKFAVSFVERLDLGEANKLKCSHSLGVVDVLRPPLEKMGIDFFDSRENVMNEKNRENLYFPDDAHWNEVGVALVAAKLAPRLRSRLPEVRVK